MNYFKKIPIVFLFLSLLTFVLSACGTGSGPTSIPDSSEQGTLVWSEEFNGTSLDTSIWNYDLGYGDNGWGNDESQLYTSDPENIKVENGYLVITAKCDPSAGNNADECGVRDGSITSARINTNNKFTFKYGTVKARIKSPPGEGMWSAFWMLGANFDSDGWPASGEIDIMEIYDEFLTPNTVTTAVHWDNDGHAQYGSASDPLPEPELMSDDFHIYEIDWSANQIVGRVDGQKYFSMWIDSDTMSELQNEFFLVLNVAADGTLGGSVPNSAWSNDMLVDWIQIYSNTTPPLPPPPPVTGDTAGVYSETTYDSTIPYNRIINTFDWNNDGGDNVTVDENSKDVAPKEGLVSLKAGFENNINTTFSGVVFDLGIANFGNVDLSNYTALTFSLNDSAVADFADMKIELDGGSAGKGSVQLANYLPTVSDNWSTYELPLSDFSGAALTAINFLGFYTPVDSGGNRFAGTLYFDDIYFNVACVNVGDIMFKSTVYAQNEQSTTFNVSDFCSSAGMVSADISNGSETISIDVSLDSNGHGSSLVNFGTTNELSGTIAIADGNTLTATFTDSNSNIVSDSVDVEGDGPRLVTGDTNADGFVYLYASDPTTVLDLVAPEDFGEIGPWSSGATLDNNYTAAPLYSPVFSIEPGTGWDGNDAGALAFTPFTAAGFAADYTTLHFKFKGDTYTSIFVKFSSGGVPELQKDYRLTSANVENLGNGWYDCSIRLTDFPDLASYTEFAILNFGTDMFFLTDIYFE